MKTTLLFLLSFLSVSLTAGIAGTTAPEPTNICLSCDIPDGLVVSNLTDSSATLSWNAVAGASKYTVEVEDEQNNPSIFQIETNVTTNSYTVTGLQAGVLYKFKVRSRCGSNKSNWSDWTFFTAAGGGSNGSCAVVTGLSVSITGSTATLSWTAVSGATYYYVEVEDEQNTPSVFHLEDSSATNSYVLNGLQAGVLYKFKVRSHCSGGQSDWSNWLFFNGNSTGNNGGGSGVCAVPVILSASVSGTSATLNWKSVSGATQYYVEIEDEQNTPSVFHLEVSVQDTFFKVTGLQAGVLYKFKVRSHCSGGQSDWSNELFFNGNSTGNNGGGSTGSCAKPTGAQVTVISANAAVLGWNAVPGVISYTLEIEREPSGNNPWKITQVVTTNSFQLTGLNSNTRYKFKVRANCSASTHSDWSDWKKFKTLLNFTSGPGTSGPQSLTANNTVGSANPVEMQVYPNPAQSSAIVRLQHLSAETATLRLFDLTGHLVQVQQIQPLGSSWEGSLIVEDLPEGMYLLQTQNGASLQTTKLIINRL